MKQHLEEHERDTLDMAAMGAVSGTLAEWPQVARVLRRYGILLPDTADAATVRAAAKAALEHSGAYAQRGLTAGDCWTKRAWELNQLYDWLVGGEAPPALYRYLFKRRIESRHALWQSLATRWNSVFRPQLFAWLLRNGGEQTLAGAVSARRVHNIRFAGSLFFAAGTALAAYLPVAAVACYSVVSVVLGYLHSIAQDVRKSNPYSEV